MPNKPIINLGIAPDTGTGDSARRGGEKINNLFVDTYTLMGDNALILDNTDSNYGRRSSFAENSYMVGELHPAGRWQRVNGLDAVDGSANTITRTDGSNPNVFYASRGEQLNIDLSGLIDTPTGDARAGSLPTPVRNNRFQVILPLARAGDIVRIRDMHGTWGPRSGNRARGIDVWTTPFNYQGTGTWADANPSNRHVHINDGTSDRAYSRDAVSADANNTGIVENLAGLSFTTQYSDLEFVYTGHESGWLVNRTTFDPQSVGNFTREFDSDDSEWTATGTRDEPTYSRVYTASSHGKINPIVQVGEAVISGGTVVAYRTPSIVQVDTAVASYTISTRDDTDRGDTTDPIIVGSNDIVITVDGFARFRGRIIAVQGI